MSKIAEYIKKLLVPYRVNPNNRGYDHDITTSRPIYIFYHVYCGTNDYKSIVQDQISQIRDSGLFEAATKFYISISGPQIDRECVKSLLADNKCVVFYESEDGSSYEFPSLEKMRDLSATEEFYALYLHAKGSSLSQKLADQEQVPFDTVCKNVKNWRKLMEYYVITKWHTAVNVLDDGYLTYGCLLKYVQPIWQAKPHYSGNMWWATSEAIQMTNTISEEYKRNRWNAEFWIVRDVARAYSSFDNPYLLYQLSIPECVYTGQRFSLKHLAYVFKHYAVMPKMIKRKRYLI